MSLDILKKAALVLVIIYFGLKILTLVVPALVGILGFVLKIAFVLMIVVVIWYLIEYFILGKGK